MKKLLLLCTLFVPVQIAFTQVGFYTSIQSINAPKWDKLFREEGYMTSNTDIFPFSQAIGVDLAYSSLKKGFRFSSEFSFSIYRTSGTYDSSILIDGTTDPTPFATYTDNYQIYFAALSFNLDWYILDYHTPARISSYNKTSHWLKKGLFLRVSPTIQLVGVNKGRVINNPISSFSSSRGRTDRSMKIPLKVGLGYDLGITKIITISPIFTYSYFQNVYWENFGIPAEKITILQLRERKAFRSPIHQFQFSIRFGFQFKQRD